MNNTRREPVDLFRNINISDLEWLELLLPKNDNPVPEDIFIPELPPDSVQLAFNGTSGEANLRSGLAIYQQIKSSIGRWTEKLAPGTRILDFGCGWGRIIRFFLKEVRATNLFGVDVSTIAIETCNQTLQGNFRLIDGYPPLDFSESTFDTVYAWSVFSHLPEDLHIRWVEEFARILRPGGLIVASTLPRSFIEESQRLRAHGVFTHPWQKAAAESFDDFEAALLGYDNGSFIFAPKPKAEYGMAMIPPAYVQQRWTRFFGFCEFIDKPESLGQSLIVMRKAL